MNKIYKNIEINKINHNFQGVAKIDNKNCLIDHVVVGDIVDIEIYKTASKYHLAKVINVKQHSKHRATPKCSFYQKCGGCDLQEYQDDFYYKSKKDILFQYLYTIYPELCLNQISLVHIGQNKRRRINLKYRNACYGFFEKNSNTLIEINHCINVTSEINAVIERIKNVNVPDLDSVDITHFYNGVSLHLIFNKDVNPKILNRFDILKDYVINIYYSIVGQSGETCTYFVKDISKIKLEDHIIEVPKTCFLQATQNSQDVMIQIVKDNLDKCKNICDLYCGIGTYGLPLSKNHHIYAYEGNNDMVNCIKTNALRLNLNIKAFQRDLFNQPLIVEDLKNFDGVIINPPRNGAENQCKYLARSKLKTIIYVSCNPSTLARDISHLAANFALKNVYLIDQFYWTKHFETILVLKAR